MSFKNDANPSHRYLRETRRLKTHKSGQKRSSSFSRRGSVSLRTVVICECSSTPDGEQASDKYGLNSEFTDPGDQFIGRVALVLPFVPLANVPC